MQSKNYFIEQRLARDKLRASLIDRINEIVNNENTSDETRTEAQKKDNGYWGGFGGERIDHRGSY